MQKARSQVETGDRAAYPTADDDDCQIEIDLWMGFEQSWDRDTPHLQNVPRTRELPRVAHCPFSKLESAQWPIVDGGSGTSIDLLPHKSQGARYGEVWGSRDVPRRPSGGVDTRPPPPFILSSLGIALAALAVSGQRPPRKTAVPVSKPPAPTPCRPRIRPSLFHRRPVVIADLTSVGVHAINAINHDNGCKVGNVIRYPFDNCELDRMPSIFLGQLLAPVSLVPLPHCPSLSTDGWTMAVAKSGRPSRIPYSPVLETMVDA